MVSRTPEERQASAAKGFATRRTKKQILEQARVDAIVYRGGLKQEINALEEKLRYLQQFEKLTAAAAALTGKVLLREEEIVGAALPWQGSSGIYFLIHGEKVVYVGQSICVYNRINTHAANDFMVFDRYAYVACPQEKLDSLESLYIHVFRPTLNGNLSNGAKNAPLSLTSLLR